MRFLLIIMLSLCAAGCASNMAYTPAQPETAPEISFNDSGFKAIQEGMGIDQVHQIMGPAVTIGYEYQALDYKPLTLTNPYKVQTIKDKGVIIEFYLQAIRVPDGVVSDDELMPLVFKDGKLVGQGWPLANSLHPSA